MQVPESLMTLKYRSERRPHRTTQTDIRERYMISVPGDRNHDFPIASEHIVAVIQNKDGKVYLRKRG